LTGSYTIAGLRIRLGGDILEPALLAERYAPFRADEGEADIHLEVESPGGYFNEEVASGRLASSPFLLRDGKWTLHRLDYEGVIVGPGHVRAKTDGSLGAVNGLLRHMLVVALLERGGLLLHAAGARIGDGVIALAGPSGSGKTTACRHAPAWATVLGDEQLAIRPHGDGIWAWGTPIVGELARPGKPGGGPLSAIYFLEQGDQDRITPLEPLESIRRLVACTVFYPRDSALNARALDACVAIARQVRSSRLEAGAGGSFWPLLAPADEAMG